MNMGTLDDDRQWEPLTLEDSVQRSWVIEAANQLLYWDDASLLRNSKRGRSTQLPPFHPNRFLQEHQASSPRPGSDWTGGSLVIHPTPGTDTSEAIFEPTASDVWWHVPLSDEVPETTGIPAPRDTPVVTVSCDEPDLIVATIRPFPDYGLTFTVQLPSFKKSSPSIFCEGDWEELLSDGGLHSGLAAMTYACLWTEEATGQIASGRHASRTSSRTRYDDKSVLHCKLHPEQDAFVHLSRDSIDFFLRAPAESCWSSTGDREDPWF